MVGLLLEELPTQLHFGREFIAYNFIINFSYIFCSLVICCYNEHKDQTMP